MLYSITRDFGIPSLVRIVTDDSIESILATGWLGLQEADIESVNNGPFDWSAEDSVLITIINPLTATVNPGAAIYVNIFSVFPDHQSVNPITSLLPNLQNIVAHAGGGQSLATPLNLGINVVAITATGGDSVLLPDDVVGQTVIISNRGVAEVAVYPFVGDSINQQATNTPIFVFPDETYILYGDAATNWASVNISPVLISNSGIVAHAGGGQTNATLVTTGLTVVNTVASANDSIRLPGNNVGQIFVVVNLGVSTLAVFPPVGSNFQGAATNVANPQATNTTEIYIGVTPTLLALK